MTFPSIWIINPSGTSNGVLLDQGSNRAALIHSVS